MSSAGSPEPRVRWRWLLLALAFGVCGLLFAATVGAQAVGVLAAIAAPPEPPVPGGAALTAHSSAAHGVDVWEYSMDLAPCDTVTFYQAQGGNCAVRAGWCDGDDPGVLEIDVARCVGDAAFSAFALRWRAEIAAGAQPNTTWLTLEREVSWMGGLPPETVTPP